MPPERVHQLVGEFERLINSELGHPSLAAPVGAGLAGASAYLAAEYINAESLDLALREYGPAPVPDGLRVVTQLAAALDFAAVVHVFHGALHPRDILLSADDTRITGIGVAGALERVGIAPPLRRPYSAPERVAAAWDRRADIFALAALSHELLWGRRIAGAGQHAAASLTELPGARLTALQDAFARALSEDPADRFDSALEFAEALREAFDTAGIPATASTVQTTRGDAAATEAAGVVKPEPRLPPEVRGAPRDSAPAPAVVPPPVATPSVAAQHGAAPPPKPPDLELRPPDAPRYRDIEPPRAAPQPDIPAPPPQTPRVSPSAALPAARVPPPRRRSVFGPIAAALLVGVALGFAGAQYASRDTISVDPGDTVPNATSADVAPPSTPKDATDVAVESPRPAPPPDAKPSPAAGADRSSAAAPEAPPASNPAHPVERPDRRTPPRAAGIASARTGGGDNETASGTAGRFVGRLSVDSRPAGARVFLDGRLIGTTPLSVASVRAGEHAIRLERDGYRLWSSSIRIVAAEQNRVTASLER